jgi:hypothetical protein
MASETLIIRQTRVSRDTPSIDACQAWWGAMVRPRQDVAMLTENFCDERIDLARAVGVIAGHGRLAAAKLLS